MKIQLKILKDFIDFCCLKVGSPKSEDEDLQEGNYKGQLSQVPLESWKGNWLFRKRKISGKLLGDNPVPMLIPNPNADVPPKIGDRQVPHTYPSSPSQLDMKLLGFTAFLFFFFPGMLMSCQIYQSRSHISQLSIPLKKSLKLPQIMNNTS